MGGPSVPESSGQHAVPVLAGRSRDPSRLREEGRRLLVSRKQTETGTTARHLILTDAYESARLDPQAVLAVFNLRRTALRSRQAQTEVPVPTAAPAARLARRCAKAQDLVADSARLHGATDRHLRRSEISRRLLEHPGGRIGSKFGEQEERKFSSLVLFFISK